MERWVKSRTLSKTYKTNLTKLTTTLKANYYNDYFSQNKTKSSKNMK